MRLLDVPCIFILGAFLYFITTLPAAAAVALPQDIDKSVPSPPVGIQNDDENNDDQYCDKAAYLGVIRALAEAAADIKVYHMRTENDDTLLTSYNNTQDTDMWYHNKPVAYQISPTSLAIPDGTWCLSIREHMSVPYLCVPYNIPNLRSFPQWISTIRVRHVLYLRRHLNKGAFLDRSTLTLSSVLVRGKPLRKAWISLDTILNHLLNVDL